MILDFGIASAGRELLEEAAAKKTAAPAAPPVDATLPVGAVFKPDHWDRTVVSSAVSIEKDTLASYLRSAEQGDTSHLYAFYDEMRVRDPHLDGELEKATLYLVGSVQDVLSYPSETRKPDAKKKPDAKRSLDIASYVRSQTYSPDVRLDLAIRALADGLWKGIGGFEVEVETIGPDGKNARKDGLERVVGFTPIPSQRFRQEPLGHRILLQKSGDWHDTVPIEELGAKVVVLIADPGIPSIVRKGLLRRLLGYWLIKHKGVLWWAQFVQKYGMPTPVGYFSREEDIEDLKSLLFDFGANRGGVFREGTRIEFLEAIAKLAAETPHERIADWCDRATSKRVHGHDQSAGVRENAGSKESTQTGDDVAVRMTNGRGVEISATLRGGYVRPLVARNFGVQDAQERCPEIPIRMEQQRNLLVISETFKNFKDAGVIGEIAKSTFHDISGLPVPEDDEERLEQPEPPAPVPPPKAAARVLPFRGAADASPAKELERLEEQALRGTAGAGAEILAPFQRVIDQAEKEGLSLSQLYARVFQASELPADSPRLVDLIAAVQLEATLRGWTRERKTKR